MMNWLRDRFASDGRVSQASHRKVARSRDESEKKATKINEENERLNRRIAALEDEIKLRDQRLATLAETVEMQRAFISEWQAIFERGRAVAIGGQVTP